MTDPNLPSMAEVLPVEFTGLSWGTRVNIIILGSILLQALSTLFFAARVYSRAKLLRNWSFDDTLLSLAWVLSVVDSVLNVYTTKYGSGQHMGDVSPEDMSMMAKIMFIGTPIFNMALGLTKLSICALYMRTLSHTFWSRASVTCCAIFIIVSLFCVEAVAIFQCWPISKMWDFSPASIAEGGCLDIRISVLSSSAVNIIADLWLIAIALPVILKLQVGLQQKFALLVVVLLGLIVMATGVLRMAFITSLGTPDLSVDIPWNSCEILLLGSAEMNIGIACAAVLAVRPLLRSWVPGMGGSLQSSDTFSVVQRKADEESDGSWQSQSDQKFPEHEYREDRPARKFRSNFMSFS